VGKEAAQEAEDDDRGYRDRQPFSETLAPFGGLGYQESGKEHPEVDEDAVRLDHAQLHGT
jgi:hypothetical protein